jgi:hypothetical protein
MEFVCNLEETDIFSKIQTEKFKKSLSLVSDEDISTALTIGRFDLKDQNKKISRIQCKIFFENEKLFILSVFLIKI